MIRMGQKWWRQWATISFVLLLWQVIMKPMIGQATDPFLAVVALGALAASLYHAKLDSEDGFN